MVSFIQANFEAVRSQVEIAQKVRLDHSVLGAMIANEFPPESAFYFLGHVINPVIIAQIEKAFVADQLENHMDEMMSSTIRSQLSFLGYDQDEERQRVENYINSCYDFIIQRFKEIEVTEEMLYEQARNFKWPGSSFFDLFDAEQFRIHRRTIMKVYFEANVRPSECKILFTQEYFNQLDHLFLQKLNKNRRLLFYELFFNQVNFLIDEHEKVVTRYSVIRKALNDQKNEKIVEANLDQFMKSLSLNDSEEVIKTYFKSISFDFTPEKIKEAFDFFSTESIFDSFDIAQRFNLDFHELLEIIDKKEVLFLDFKRSFDAKDGESSDVGYLEIVRSLSEADRLELIMLLTNFSEKSKLGVSTLLKVVSKFSNQIMTDHNEMIDSIKEELFVKAHNFILEQYDFFIADELQEKLKNPEIYDEMIEKITQEILSTHSLSLFQKNLKNFFVSSESESEIIVMSIDEQKDIAFTVMVRELEFMSIELGGEGW